MWDCVLAHKDVVKVDGPASNEIQPLGIRELQASWVVEEGGLDELGVTGKVLQSFLSFSEYG